MKLTLNTINKLLRQPAAEFMFYFKSTAFVNVRGRILDCDLEAGSITVGNDESDDLAVTFAFDDVLYYHKKKPVDDRGPNLKAN